VFRTLQALLPDFTEASWTSSYKKYAFPELPNFKDRDSSSDFTYYDATGVLAAILEIVPDGPKTFLLEVKASKNPENSFQFSSRQLQLVRTLNPKDLIF
jgi:hypothetical protein